MDGSCRQTFVVKMFGTTNIFITNAKDPGDIQHKMPSPLYRNT